MIYARKIRRYLCASLFYLFPIALYAQQPTAVYTLDVKKSKVYWKSPRAKLAKPHFGTLLFKSGSLDFSGGMPVGGAFSIDMNSVKANDNPKEESNKRVEELLRGNEYFATAKYPQATIVVNRITPLAKALTYQVSASLTLKGITNPIVFDATITPSGAGASALASLSIDRLKWRILIDNEAKQEFKPWDVMSNLSKTVKNSLFENEIPVTLELVFTKK